MNGIDAKEVLIVVHELIGIIGRARESFAEDEGYAPIFEEDANHAKGNGRILRTLKLPPDMALRLCLLASKSADKAKHEELCYEFYVQV